MTFTCKFVLVFLSQTFSIHRTAEEGKGISLTPHQHFHPLHRHLDISWAITVESLPLHIASSQIQTGKLIHTYVILKYLYTYILHIYIHIYTLLLLTPLRKKENALIIHSAMETWKYAIIRNFVILSLCPISKISHPLDSEPATPLTNLYD